MPDFGEPLDINIRKLSNVRIIQLRGGLKLGPELDKFKVAVDGLLQNGDSNIVLNLAEVPIIDSSGIGVLVRCLTSLKQRGGSLKLVGPSKMVLQTLKLVGILNLFEIHESDDAAVQSFG